MIYIAKIENNIVSQVFIAREDYELKDSEVVIGLENTVGVGFIFEDGEFKQPEPNYNSED